MLRNKTVANMVKDCDYYNDKIEYESYIDPWKVKPEFTYNEDKKCRQLEESRFLHQPLTDARTMDNIFYYKKNLPREHFGFNLIQFSSKKLQYFFLFIVLALVLFIII